MISIGEHRPACEKRRWPMKHDNDCMKQDKDHMVWCFVDFDDFSSLVGGKPRLRVVPAKL